MRQLGIPALAHHFSASSAIPQETENHNKNEDPDFDYNAEDDTQSDGNLSDDNLQDMENGPGGLKHKVLDLPLYCIRF